MAATECNLRSHLRQATARSHDRLDRAMRPASDWQSREDYARFLSAQHAARLPVEGWLAFHAPAGLIPPAQTPLIARDLVELGAQVPSASHGYCAPFVSAYSALGVAWVLAGSSLGNRAMLRDMERALPGDATWPHEFLASRAMTGFWKALRPQIESAAPPAALREAEAAAIRVFDHFLAHSDASALEATS